MGIASRIASRPAVREAASVLVDIARDKIAERRRGGSVSPSTGERATMVNEAAAAIAERPALVNAMNAEPLSESRTFLASATTFVTSLGVVLAQAGSESGFDWEIGGPAIGTLIAGLIGIIGRSVKGLKPIDWRRPWTLFGIGR